MQAECRVCGKFKPKFRGNRHPTKPSFYYVNERGKLWSGMMCPECNAMSMHIKNKERARNGAPPRTVPVYPADRTPIWELGPRSPQYADKIRKCKHCGCNTYNYFMCGTCHDSLNTKDCNDFLEAGF